MEKDRSYLERALDALEETLWPTRCVGCDAAGELLCESCRSELPWIDQSRACPVCGAPYGRMVCTECKRDWPGDGVACALSYEGVARRIVTTYKDHHETRLAALIAQGLWKLLQELSKTADAEGSPRLDLSSLDGIVVVPDTAEARARRGFDHMELIGKHLSRLSGLPLFVLLENRSTADLRHLGKEKRARQMESAIACTQSTFGIRLLLVDDVITTGTTVKSCMRSLKAQGAPYVFTAAFARVW